MTDSERLQWLALKLAGLVEQMRELERRLRPRLEAVEPQWRASALNLCHYVALRLEDVRELQSRLAELGLSSLGRSEPGVLSNVEAVRGLVARLKGQPYAPEPDPAPTSSEGRRLLAAHADALFGPARVDHPVRVMVTMPTEAACEPKLVHSLVAAGMDVMRINCAHDDPGAWRRMAAHLRAANAALGATCRVQLDLPGPKLRTGEFEPGPRVLHLSPLRGTLGELLKPARVRLLPQGTPGLGLGVPRRFFDRLKVGRRIDFVDHLGRSRRLEVVSVDDTGAWAVARKSAWLTPSTVLTTQDEVQGIMSVTPLGVQELPGVVELNVGDRLLLCGPDVRGRAGAAGEPALVPCTMPEVLQALRPGHRIWFDDGKIGGVVEELDGQRALVRLTDGRPKGMRLRADQGINLPDTDLDGPALGPDDLTALDVACEVGDLVALSFCRSDDDVLALQQALDARRSRLGVVLKVENRQGFESLSSLLLAAMRRPPFGVMIARGDLAVECGFARLAEVQEEMLCLCEAAHAPVIWATQVLETAARKGFPSRAEVTDAAVGERAECVMLNKGPYVLQAVKTLEDILSRMQSHQRKKTPLLRRLKSLGLD